MWAISGYALNTSYRVWTRVLTDQMPVQMPVFKAWRKVQCTYRSYRPSMVLGESQ